MWTKDSKTIFNKKPLVELSQGWISSLVEQYSKSRNRPMHITTKEAKYSGNRVVCASKKLCWIN